MKFSIKDQCQFFQNFETAIDGDIVFIIDILNTNVLTLLNLPGTHIIQLKIRFRDKTNEDTQYLHTLNSTLIATTRVMVSIMENFQTKDGHIRIPSVLQSYMGNQKEI